VKVFDLCVSKNFMGTLKNSLKDTSFVEEFYGEGV